MTLSTCLLACLPDPQQAHELLLFCILYAKLLWVMLSVWDKQMARTQFKWWWLHTPTYAAYTVEGIYVPLLLGATGAVKSVRSAALVLSSLTPNAQSVFRCLADFQIAHPDDQGTNYRTDMFPNLQGVCHFCGQHFVNILHNTMVHFTFR